MLVAFSGGPDSTTLLLSLVEAGVPVIAAHFDHDLRPESAADSEWVAERCRAWGVPLIRGRREGRLAAGSIQAAARAIRYDFLERARRSSGMELVALGHTADDLVEGTLLHLLRGAGLAGMRGMPDSLGSYRRPLLQAWRGQVEAFLAARHVVALRDPSNTDPRYSRIRVRTQLLPQLELDRPGIKNRLHTAARRAAEYQARLEKAAARVPAAGGQVALEDLARVPAAIRVELINRLYREASNRSQPLASIHHAAVTQLVERGRSGQTIDLPAGVRIRRGYQHVQVYGMAPPVPTPAARLSLRPCTGCSSAGAAHFPLGTDLRLGERVPGLRMRPLPGGRLRKLQDILVDAKVPRHLRDGLALVFADAQLAWVPGIAVDRRWVVEPGHSSIHAEVVGSRNALLESVQPTQGVLS